MAAGEYTFGDLQQNKTTYDTNENAVPKFKLSKQGLEKMSRLNKIEGAGSTASSKTNTSKALANLLKYSKTVAEENIGVGPSRQAQAPALNLPPVLGINAPSTGEKYDYNFDPLSLEAPSYIPENGKFTGPTSGTTSESYKTVPGTYLKDATIGDNKYVKAARSANINQKDLRGNLPGNFFQIDHIIPLEFGGSPDDPNNLQSLTLPQHMAKTKGQAILRTMVNNGDLDVSAARALSADFVNNMDKWNTEGIETFKDDLVLSKKTAKKYGAKSTNQDDPTYKEAVRQYAKDRYKEWMTYDPNKISFGDFWESFKEKISGGFSKDVEKVIEQRELSEFTKGLSSGLTGNWVATELRKDADLAEQISYIAGNAIGTIGSYITLAKFLGGAAKTIGTAGKAVGATKTMQPLTQSLLKSKEALSKLPIIQKITSTTPKLADLSIANMDKLMKSKNAANSILKGSTGKFLIQGNTVQNVLGNTGLMIIGGQLSRQNENVDRTQRAMYDVLNGLTTGFGYNLMGYAGDAISSYALSLLENPEDYKGALTNAILSTALQSVGHKQYNAQLKQVSNVINNEIKNKSNIILTSYLKPNSKKPFDYFTSLKGASDEKLTTLYNIISGQIDKQMSSGILSPEGGQFKKIQTAISLREARRASLPQAMNLKQSMQDLLNIGNEFKFAKEPSMGINKRSTEYHNALLNTDAWEVLPHRMSTKSNGSISTKELQDIKTYNENVDRVWKQFTGEVEAEDANNLYWQQRSDIVREAGMDDRIFTTGQGLDVDDFSNIIKERGVKTYPENMSDFVKAKSSGFASDKLVLSIAPEVQPMVTTANIKQGTNKYKSPEKVVTITGFVYKPTLNGFKAEPKTIGVIPIKEHIAARNTQYATFKEFKPSSIELDNVNIYNALKENGGSSLVDIENFGTTKAKQDAPENSVRRWMNILVDKNRKYSDVVKTYKEAFNLDEYKPIFDYDRNISVEDKVNKLYQASNIPEEIMELSKPLTKIFSDISDTINNTKTTKARKIAEIVEKSNGVISKQDAVNIINGNTTTGEILNILAKSESVKGTNIEKAIVSFQKLMMQSANPNIRKFTQNLVKIDLVNKDALLKNLQEKISKDINNESRIYNVLSNTEKKSTFKELMSRLAKKEGKITDKISGRIIGEDAKLTKEKINYVVDYLLGKNTGDYNANKLHSLFSSEELSMLREIIDDSKLKKIIDDAIEIKKDINIDIAQDRDKAINTIKDLAKTQQLPLIQKKSPKINSLEDINKKIEIANNNGFIDGEVKMAATTETSKIKEAVLETKNKPILDTKLADTDFIKELRSRITKENLGTGDNLDLTKKSTQVWNSVGKKKYIAPIYKELQNKGLESYKNYSNNKNKQNNIIEEIGMLDAFAKRIDYDTIFSQIQAFQVNKKTRPTQDNFIKWYKKNAKETYKIDINSEQIDKALKKIYNQFKNTKPIEALDYNQKTGTIKLTTPTKITSKNIESSIEAKIRSLQLSDPKYKDIGIVRVGDNALNQYKQFTEVKGILKDFLKNGVIPLVNQNGTIKNTIGIKIPKGIVNKKDIDAFLGNIRKDLGLGDVDAYQLSKRINLLDNKGIGGNPELKEKVFVLDGTKLGDDFDNLTGEINVLKQEVLAESKRNNWTKEMTDNILDKVVNDGIEYMTPSSMDKVKSYLGVGNKNKLLKGVTNINTIDNAWISTKGQTTTLNDKMKNALKKKGIDVDALESEGNIVRITIGDNIKLGKDKLQTDSYGNKFIDTTNNSTKYLLKDDKSLKEGTWTISNLSKFNNVDKEIKADLINLFLPQATKYNKMIKDIYENPTKAVEIIQREIPKSLETDKIFGIYKDLIDGGADITTVSNRIITLLTKHLTDKVLRNTDIKSGYNTIIPDTGMYKIKGEKTPRYLKTNEIGLTSSTAKTLGLVDGDKVLTARYPIPQKNAMSSLVVKIIDDKNVGKGVVLNWYDTFVRKEGDYDGDGIMIYNLNSNKYLKNVADYIEKQREINPDKPTVGIEGSKYPKLDWTVDNFVQVIKNTTEGKSLVGSISNNITKAAIASDNGISINGKQINLTNDKQPIIAQGLQAGVDSGKSNAWLKMKQNSPWELDPVAISNGIKDAESYIKFKKSMYNMKDRFDDFVKLPQLAKKTAEDLMGRGFDKWSDLSEQITMDYTPKDNAGYIDYDRAHPIQFISDYIANGTKNFNPSTKNILNITEEIGGINDYNFDSIITPKLKLDTDVEVGKVFAGMPITITPEAKKFTDKIASDLEYFSNKSSKSKTFDEKQSLRKEKSEWQNNITELYKNSKLSQKDKEAISAILLSSPANDTHKFNTNKFTYWKKVDGKNVKQNSSYFDRLWELILPSYYEKYFELKKESISKEIKKGTE